MLELLIVRHAKSDWNASHAEDHQRPLAPRGERAARRLGRYLAEIARQPQHVLSSSAVRARNTVQLAAEAGAWSCNIEIRDALYGASVDGWLREVATVAPGVERLLVAGHEPTCSEVVRRLTGARARMPTAAIACVRLGAQEWSTAGERASELQWLVKPKILPADRR